MRRSLRGRRRARTKDSNDTLSLSRYTDPLLDLLDPVNSPVDRLLYPDSGYGVEDPMQSPGPHLDEVQRSVGRSAAEPSRQRGGALQGTKAVHMRLLSQDNSPPLKAAVKDAQHCISRQQRKEVLFAKGRTGLGGTGRGEYKPPSKIKC